MVTDIKTHTVSVAQVESMRLWPLIEPISFCMHVYVQNVRVFIQKLDVGQETAVKAVLHAAVAAINYYREKK